MAGARLIPIGVGHESDTWPPSRDNGQVGIWRESIRGDWMLRLADGYIQVEVVSLPEDFDDPNSRYVYHVRITGETVTVFPDRKHGVDQGIRWAEQLLKELLRPGERSVLDPDDIKDWVQTYSDECWDMELSPRLNNMRLKIYHDFDHEYYDKHPGSLYQGDGIKYVKYVQINGWRMATSFPVTSEGIDRAKKFARDQFEVMMERAKEDFEQFSPIRRRTYR